jgi:hypothetical protein
VRIGFAGDRGLELLEHRNLTSHTYREEDLARAICGRIPADCEAMREVVEKLRATS